MCRAKARSPSSIARTTRTCWSPAQPWFGMSTFDPFNAFGKPARADGYWSGWVYAVDADTGVWKWRLKSNYPILSGMTPTAGGIVFFGDVGGNFYTYIGCRQRRTAVGRENRRCDRRRCDHLYIEWCTKSRGGDRLDVRALANENCDREDRNPSPENSSGLRILRRL
jgi:hypothetical protein